MNISKQDYIKADPDHTPSVWYSILLTALTSMGVLSVTLYVPAMLGIADDFQVDKVSVQVTLSLFLFGFAFGQLVYGPLSDQFGRRPVLLSGIAFYVASSFICALAQDIEALQFARLFQGIGACCGAVISRAVVRDLYHQDQAIRVFAFVATALSLTPAIAPIIGGQLTVWFNWQACFYFLAVVGSVMFIWSFFHLKESNTEKLSGAINPIRLAKIYWQVISNLRFVALVMISSLLFGGLMSYTTLSPFLMLEELQLTPDQYGLLIMFTAAAYGFGSYMSGRLVKVIGHQAIMIGGPIISIGGALLMLALSFELSIIYLVLPASIYLIGNGFVAPTTMAAAMQPFPRIAGSASAMMGGFQMGVAGIVSVLVNKVYDATALPLSQVMLGLAFASLACAFYVIFTDRQIAAKQPV
ncbi:multidrug effflux MFS transporter [Curvivirga aplysinae]|uniref:multidrug effflux MFS transporter n=1 Tax=Curvivirga aplysinae TaxID=2529852 RepID=UPI0012BBDE91|nr:multidrug effflux MFS transporter [Curvivirga aplysinae]MTI10899.1 Bcr/CflA family efflux MFS transporter [Curvivirga aplysinae]